MNKNIKSKIAYLIVFICIMLNHSFSYAAEIYEPTVGFEKISPYLIEDEESDNNVNFVTSFFMQNFIKDYMTDFEKEIQIIKYLVETIDYDETIDEYTTDLSNSFLAYGALVNHRAVCSGYAKAFELLCRECNIPCAIVTGKSKGVNHAWNQIMLDGEWYNVDVTYEDPITNVHYGINELRNKYINRTDAEFNVDHIRENGNVCYATKYGKNVVSYYLSTGIIDFAPNMDLLRDNLILLHKNLLLANRGNVELLHKNPLNQVGARYDNMSNYFPELNDILINNYIKFKIMSGEDYIIFTTCTDSAKKLQIDTGEWLSQNIQVERDTRMQIMYMSGEEYDTRIIIFDSDKYM